MNTADDGINRFLFNQSGKFTNGLSSDNPRSTGNMITSNQALLITTANVIKDDIKNVKDIFLQFIDFNKDQVYRDNLYKSSMNDKNNELMNKLIQSQDGSRRKLWTTY